MAVSGLGSYFFTSKTFGKSQEPVKEIPLKALQKAFGEGRKGEKTLTIPKATAILLRLISKMDDSFVKRSSNARYQADGFKDLFAKLILVEPFSNCLFGKYGCFARIPGDIISKFDFTTLVAANTLATKVGVATSPQLKHLMFTLGKKHFDLLLAIPGQPSSSCVSDDQIKALLKHLECPAQLDKLDRSACLVLLNKHYADTDVTEASQFYAQPVLVFTNGEGGSTHSTDSHFPQKVVAGTHNGEVEDDLVLTVEQSAQLGGTPRLYEVPVHTDDTHLATALGFSPQFFDYVSVDPTTKLHNNQIVIHPTDPGKFAVSMKSDKGRVATYPLAFDQESDSWMLLGKPLAEFLPQVVLKEEDLYATVVDSQPIYGNTVSGGDYSFRVSPFGTNGGLTIMYFLGGKSEPYNLHNSFEALEFTHKLTTAADARMPAAVFRYFNFEPMTSTNRADDLGTRVGGRARPDYSFCLSPHQAASNETNPPKFMVTYFLGGEIKEQPCASLQEASQLSARLLKAGELKVPADGFKYFSLEAPDRASMKSGECVIYQGGDNLLCLSAAKDNGQKIKIHDYKIDGTLSQAVWTTNDMYSYSHNAQAPLKDIISFYTLPDPLLLQFTMSGQKKNFAHARPDFANLVASKDSLLDLSSGTFSATKMGTFKSGGRDVDFVASADPSLSLSSDNKAVNLRAEPFYGMLSNSDLNLGAVIRLNSENLVKYYPEAVGGTETFGEFTVSTTRLQTYSFTGLATSYDKGRYPDLDISKLKIEVRELLVNGQKKIHINVGGWPDHQALPPEILKAIATFINQTLQKEGVEGVVGHCKAGAGRTGTLFTALRFLGDGSSIVQTVTDARNRRGGFVQDDLQAVSLFEMSRLAASSVSLSSQSDKSVAVFSLDINDQDWKLSSESTQVDVFSSDVVGVLDNAEFRVYYDTNFKGVFLAYLDDTSQVVYMKFDSKTGTVVPVHSETGEIVPGSKRVLLGTFLLDKNLTLKAWEVEPVAPPVPERPARPQVNPDTTFGLIGKVSGGAASAAPASVTVGGKTFLIDETLMTRAALEKKPSLRVENNVVFRPASVAAVKDAGGYAFSHFKDGEWKHYLCRKEGDAWQCVGPDNKVIEGLETFFKEKRIIVSGDVTINTPGNGAVIATRSGDVHVTTKGQPMLGTGSFGAVKSGTFTVTDRDMMQFIQTSGIKFKEITQDGKKALVIEEGLVAKKIELQMMQPAFITGKDFSLEGNRLILNCTIDDALTHIICKDPANRRFGTQALEKSIESVRLEAEMGMRFDHPHVGRTVAVSDPYPNGKLHVMLGNTRYQLWAKGADGKPAPVPTVKMFMLQEEIKGEELFYVVTRTPEAKKMNWFFQILAGVAHMHTQNVAHRDLKLENVMIDDKGNAKIMDFGFSREPGHPDFQLVQGTPGYASPEIFTKTVIRGQEFKVDAFAAAALGFAMFFNPNLGSPYLGDKGFFQENIVKTGGLKSPALFALRVLLIKMGHADPTQRLSVADCIAAIKQDKILGPLYLKAVIGV